MEHEWNSLIGWFYIHGDRSMETLFAHELAHQWWGDLVTLADWRDLWLNEGFATYCEYLYAEHAYGWTAMRETTAKIDSVYIARLDMLDHPVLDPPAQWPFTFTVYRKGGRILDMLRGVSRLRLMTGGPRPPAEWEAAGLAGDDRFFRIFSRYAQDHADGNVTTADFRAAAEAELGEDLGWFFDPWLSGRAFPDLQARWFRTSSLAATRVSVELAQVQGGTQFRLPIQVRYRDGDHLLDEVRELDGPAVTWSVDLPPGKWGVEIDPDDWLLDRHVSQEIVPEPQAVEITPNPSRTGFDVTATLGGPGPTPVAFAIYDLEGRRVRGWPQTSLPPGFFQERWDGLTEMGRPAAAGVYVARVAIGNEVVVRRLVVLR
jgi:aminopeptidase N